MEATPYVWGNAFTIFDGQCYVGTGVEWRSWWAKTSVCIMDRKHIGGEGVLMRVKLNVWSQLQCKARGMINFDNVEMTLNTYTQLCIFIMWSLCLSMTMQLWIKYVSYPYSTIWACCIPQCSSLHLGVYVCKLWTPPNLANRCQRISQCCEVAFEGPGFNICRVIIIYSFLLCGCLSMFSPQDEF